MSHRMRLPPAACLFLASRAGPHPTPPGKRFLAGHSPQRVVARHRTLSLPDLPKEPSITPTSPRPVVTCWAGSHGRTAADQQQRVKGESMGKPGSLLTPLSAACPPGPGAPLRPHSPFLRSARTTIFFLQTGTH